MRSGRDYLCYSRLALIGNFQPRFAPALNQLFDVLGRPPLTQQPACDGSEVRPQLEQIPDGFACGLPFSELAIRGSQHHVRAHVPWQIEIERRTERGAVVTLPVRVVEVGKPVKTGVVGIQLLGARRQRSEEHTSELQ